MYKRNSKILAALLTIVLVFSIFPSLRVNAAVIASGYCGDPSVNDGKDVTWTLDDAGTLTISGTGAMENYIFYKDPTSGVYRDSYPWYEQKDTITKVVIEEGVTYVGVRAFRDLSNLESVTLPDSVTVIGDRSFQSCPNLSSINLPNKLTLIDNYAFSECSSLTSIVFPSTLTTIGENAFERCYGLTEIDIPDSVTTLGDQAFTQCTSLKSATLSNQLTELPDTFYGCSQLTSVTIPDSVTTLNGTFYECTSLKNITIPNSVTYIGGAFEGCTSLESITIPNSVTSIGYHAFWGCTSLTGITIPNSVTSIGDRAFFDCTSLKSITIPNSVTSIGDRAFFDCTSLESITIPNSVTSIGDKAFDWCTSLTDVTMTQILYDSIDPTDVFNGTYPTFNLIPSGYCGDPNVNGGKDVTWIFDDTTGTLTISGTGDMLDIVTISTDPWSAIYTSLKTIVINDGVTSIGANAFKGCTNLTSITIPDSVTSIEHDTFRFCTSLASITIPDSVTSIGYEAFYDCSSLTGITIPDSVTSIGDWAFFDCDSLTDVTMSKDLYDNLVKKGKLNDVFYGITLPSIHFSYTVNYNSNGNGTITGTTKSFGTDQIELTIQPDNYYVLDKIEWSDGTNTVKLTATNGKYTMPDTEAGAVTLTATFKLDQKTVTFKNEDGTVLQSGLVDCGTTPAYTGTTLTKSEDDQYTYTFAGWSDGTKTYGPTDTLPAVTDDATYTAVFDSTVKQYTIKFVDEDGSVLQSGNFDYGTTPVYTGTTPTKAEDDDYTYTFAGWTPAVTSVTGNATYTATFTTTAKTTTSPTTPAPTTPTQAPTTPAPVTVSKPGTYYLSSMTEQDGNIVITIKMSEDDTKTFDLLGSVTSDGVPLTEGNQYTAAKGSAIITINKSFLDTLSAGTHKLTVTFTDGGSITIDYEVKAPAAAPQAAAQAVQATGEAVSAASIAGACLILAAAGIAFTMIRKRKKEA